MSWALIWSNALLWLFTLCNFLLIVLIARYLRGSSLTFREARTARSGPRIGSRVPDRLLDLVGVRSEDRDDHIIVFLSTTCPFCASARDVVRESNPRVNLRVVCEGPSRSLDEFLDPVNGTVPVTRDSERRVASEWKVTMMPFAIAIDGEARVRAKQARIAPSVLDDLEVALIGEADRQVPVA